MLIPEYHKLRSIHKLRPFVVNYSLPRAPSGRFPLLSRLHQLLAQQCQELRGRTKIQTSLYTNTAI